MVFERILIATDGSERAEGAVRLGLGLARALGAGVTGLHVLRGAPLATVDRAEWECVEAELQEASERVLAFLRDEARARGVAVATKATVGEPADEIIKESRHHSLVVLGTLGRGALDHLLLGSVAEGVVRHAPCPVLVVPLERAVEEPR